MKNKLRFLFLAGLLTILMACDINLRIPWAELNPDTVYFAITLPGVRYHHNSGNEWVNFEMAGPPVNRPGDGSGGVLNPGPAMMPPPETAPWWFPPGVLDEQHRRNAHRNGHFFPGGREVVYLISEEEFNRLTSTAQTPQFSIANAPNSTFQSAPGASTSMGPVFNGLTLHYARLIGINSVGAPGSVDNPFARDGGEAPHLFMVETLNRGVISFPVANNDFGGGVIIHEGVGTWNRMVFYVFSGTGQAFWDNNLIAR